MVNVHGWDLQPSRFGQVPYLSASLRTSGDNREAKILTIRFHELRPAQATCRMLATIMILLQPISVDLLLSQPRGRASDPSAIASPYCLLGEGEGVSSAD